MPNRNYKRGYAFERRLKLYLESIGYLVIRAGGSHGLADLVAIPQKGKPLLIQCKTKAKLFSKHEREEMIKLELNYEVSCFFAYREKNRIVIKNPNV